MSLPAAWTPTPHPVTPATGPHSTPAPWTQLGTNIRIVKATNWGGAVSPLRELKETFLFLQTPESKETQSHQPWPIGK